MAPGITFIYLLFNIIIGIMIAAFASENVSIGNSNSMSGDVPLNTTSDVSVGDSLDWFKGFFVTLFGLPWWLNTLFATLEIGGLTIVILSWVRGV